MKLLFRLFIVLFFSLFILNCKEESNPITTNEEHLEPEGWLITDSLSKPILHVWQGTIASSWNNEPINDTLILTNNILSKKFFVNLLDSNKSILDFKNDEDLTFGWSISDTSKLKLIQSGNWEFVLEGKQGSTDIEFQILHSGHVDVRTPKIPVVIIPQTGNK